jgi:Zn-dependent protease with chaperone function
MNRTISVAQSEPAQPWGASTSVDPRFHEMVARLEVFARQKPSQYRGRVFRRALLGYGYIGIVLLFLLLCVGAVVTFMVIDHAFNALTAKLALFLIIAVFYVLRSLIVKISAPNGIEVTRRQAPELFAALDRIQRQLRGPRIDAVYIDDDFNAAIVQRPRWGGLAGHANYLILGLPLLTALPSDEVLAVIGHEYGHLAGAHGKMTAWVYRVRMTWLQLSQAFGKGVMAGLFRKFFSWYGPWFAAYSFVLARGNEYEADRASVDVAGHAAARALVRVAIENQRHGRYWSQVFAGVGDTAQPAPYAGMARYFRAPAVEADIDGALAAAMNVVTDLHDTHPCLKDRLAAIGADLPELPAVTQGGDEALLGRELAQALATRMDTAWWRKAGGHWSERHEDAIRQRARLAALTEREAELDAAELSDYRDMLEESGQMQAALAAARRTYAASQGLGAQLALGRLLAILDEREAIDVLETVMEAGGPYERVVAASYASDALERWEDTRLEVWRARFETAREAYDLYQQELNTIEEGQCRLEPHGLDETSIAALRTRAAKRAMVRNLWVARRALKSAPGRTQFIVMIDNDRDFVDDALEVLAPFGACIAIIKHPSTEWLKNRMEQTPGSHILRR